MVKLVCAASLFAGLALCQNPAVTVTVDAAANRHAINPNVYGIAYGTPTTLADLNAPLNRQGGNNTSRYNWQANADNRGQDWYFESIGDTSAVAGERGDTFISSSKTAGAQPMLTIPMIGWVAKLGTNRSKLASFSQAKYGAQTGNDAQWYPDAGNGILKSTNQNITGNDPADANVAADSLYQQVWMQHLVNTFGTAGAGGLKYYILDNEPSIWHSTHRDVSPTGVTMDQLKTKILDYAGRVKTTDPMAQVVGPEEWGWSGYFYSGYDQQYGSLHGWSNLPDRVAHGNADYLPWLLDQLRQTTVAGGLRPLDVFSVHYYPQGGEFGNDTSSAMQLRRNRSTRSLWDPNYVDETWINDKVQLIPRLRNWVNTYYFAGTPIAITEYNWGAESHINGATTQADIYGIFGRENLDMAARWTTPDPSTPTYKAMKLYRNYDGNKSGFGDTSVLASVPSPDNVSAFAATRTGDGALTVMVINKYLTGSTPVTINTANFSGNGSAQVYQLTSTNAITRLSDVAYSGTSFSATVPQQSVTLFVLASGTPNTPPTAVIAAPAGPVTGNAPFAVSFDGTGSSDADGSISSYAWTFGDGTQATGITASHTYTTAGSYTAKLTVTDNRGATAFATVAITVNPDPTILNAPSNLAASAASGVVTLTWKDNSSNEDGFYIERAPSGSTSFLQVGSVGANIVKYTESRPKGAYLYRVRAFNAVKTSAYSNQVQIRINK
jgi:PKD repeat protein